MNARVCRLHARYLILGLLGMMGTTVAFTADPLPTAQAPIQGDAGQDGDAA